MAPNESELSNLPTPLISFEWPFARSRATTSPDENKNKTCFSGMYQKVNWLKIFFQYRVIELSANENGRV